MKNPSRSRHTLQARQSLRKTFIAGLTLGCLSLALLFFFPTQSAPNTGRVTDGLVVLYDFQSGSGNTVYDVSGVGSPLDLVIANPSNTQWITDGGIKINNSTVIASSGAATKVIDALKATNEITVEVWVKNDNKLQSGPARIMTLSKDGYERNFTLAQDFKEYQGRLRTTTTTQNGMPVIWTNGGVLDENQVQHVVFTRNALGVEHLYINNVLIRTGTRLGDFSNWDNSMRLGLANELTQDRDWLGEIYLAAVYEKALNPVEIAQNFTDGISIFPGFEAIMGTFPGWDGENWAPDLSQAYTVDLIATGTPGKKKKSYTLNIPSPETVSHILIETISKSGSVDVTYETALGTVSPGGVGMPLAGTTSSMSFQHHRALLKGDPSVSTITVETTDAHKTQGITAYVFRPSSGEAYQSSGLLAGEWFYRTSKTYDIAIPSSPTTRDVRVLIPVTEMSNDGRMAIFSATAGRSSDIDTIYTYDPSLGESMRIVQLDLKDVPPSVNTMQVKSESPQQNGDSYSMGTMQAQSSNEDGAFPVEFTSFTVEKEENDAVLSWSTGQEMNSDYFAIERSLNGAQFEPLPTQVKAAGVSKGPRTYLFRDKDITRLPSRVIAYRLKQVDHDGEQTYSDMVEVLLPQPARIYLSTSPNPVSETLSISYQLNQSPELELTIVNSNGQLMYQQPLSTANQIQQIQLPVKNWAKGMYFIHISEDARAKFIVE